MKQKSTQMQVKSINSAKTPVIQTATFDSEKRERADALSISSTLPSLEHLNQFHHQPQSEEYDYFMDKIRSILRKKKLEKEVEPILEEWRIRDRLKTVSCLICLCLNIGVDPPDQMIPIKPENCARLECFVNPFQLTPQKSLALIGKTLSQQYEQIQPRARYKQALDPTADDLKKTLLAMRRSAKEERILFHYNGHGVPRPTSSSELWVFNKNYTQYIPVSMHDLKQWIGVPSLFVFDCYSAANLITQQTGSDYYLASCGAEETLPLDPDLPADLFTSCLTMPIETALLCFIISNRQQLLNSGIDYRSYVNRIPGRIQDRKTPLGELYWIFTAITDTIAFTTCSPELFKRLFRQDLMVAALFRNFLLAQWLMPRYGCNPVSVPALPAHTRTHELWKSWDYVMERLLLQLPNFVPKDPEIIDPLILADDLEYKKTTNSLNANVNAELLAFYQPSTFFDDQLTSFEVWLQTSSAHKQPPFYLPIILQVLLSQHYRLRALILLCKFLDLGKWAVYHALSVGIFPYILKLLQSPAQDLRLVLVFVWSRIVAVDPSCCRDLTKECGYQYFINILFSNNAADEGDQVESHSEMRAMSCFILSHFAEIDAHVLTRSSLHVALGTHLRDADPLLRQWSLLALSRLAQTVTEPVDSIWEEIVTSSCHLLSDECADVRAATLYFIRSFISHLSPVHQMSKSLTVTSLSCLWDASPTVRLELLFLVALVINQNYADICSEATEYLNDGGGGRRWQFGGDSFNACLWKVVLGFTSDPSDKINALSKSIVDFVTLKVTKNNDDINNFLSSFNSSFFEYSSEFFLLPRLRSNEDEMPGGELWAEQQWRIQRNKRIEEEPLAVCEKFDQLALLDNSCTIVTNLLFHPYSNLLISSDDSNYINVWSVEHMRKVQKFRNPELKGTRITSMALVNPCGESLLSIGSDDGMLRIYYKYSCKPQILTAWKCLPELQPDNSGVGLISHWNQQMGLFFVSGDCRVIRIWNADAEMSSQDLSTKTQQSITTLSPATDAQLIVAGGADGVLRLYDRRLKSRDACVMSWNEHETDIVQTQFSDGWDIKSISSDGNLRYWDCRSNKSLFSFQTDATRQTSCAHFHPRLPLLITGQTSQAVKIFRLNQDSVFHVSTIRAREGFLGQRLAPVTSVAWHPCQNMFATGGSEQFITMFGPKK